MGEYRTVIDVELGFAAAIPATLRDIQKFYPGIVVEPIEDRIVLTSEHHPPVILQRIFKAALANEELVTANEGNRTEVWKRLLR